MLSAGAVIAELMDMCFIFFQAQDIVLGCDLKGSIVRAEVLCYICAVQLCRNGQTFSRSQDTDTNIGICAHSTYGDHTFFQVQVGGLAVSCVVLDHSIAGHGYGGLGHIDRTAFGSGGVVSDLTTGHVESGVSAQMDRTAAVASTVAGDGAAVHIDSRTITSKDSAAIICGVAGDGAAVHIEHTTGLAILCLGQVDCTTLAVAGG